MDDKLQTRYENKLVALFFLTWGFLFIDRLAIAFVLPVIQPDLQITNAQVGVINMAFTLAWAISAVLFSGIADKKGNLKKWLLISGFLTAIFGGACSLATSYESLILLRVCIGIAEGPFSTFIMAALGKSVRGERLGVSVGIVNAGVAVIAATLGPIFLTQLVAVTTWQMAFLVAALPGFLLMIVVWYYVKPIPDAETKNTELESKIDKKNMYAELWSYRNFRICCVLAVTHMSSYYIMQIFASLYWTNVAGLSVQTAGFLISAAGFVMIFTCIILPKLSDIYGRKPVMIVTYIFALLPSLLMFLTPGSTISMVAYVVCSGLPGALGIFWINLIPMETLPAHLTSSGISIPMSMGEIIGGAVVTTFAGVIADMYGLPAMMIISACGILLSLLLCFGLIETAPRALARKQQLQEQ